MTEITLKLSRLGPQPLGKMFVVVKGNLLFLPVYLVSKVRWESLQNPTHQIIGIYGKASAERIKEYTIEYCKHFGIAVDYINENPEIMNTRKPYYNILLDDRAGLECAFNQFTN